MSDIAYLFDYAVYLVSVGIDQYLMPRVFYAGHSVAETEDIVELEVYGYAAVLAEIAIHAVFPRGYKSFAAIEDLVVTKWGQLFA